MTSKLTREWLQHQISAIEAVGITDSNTLAAFKLALAAMDSEPVAFINGAWALVYYRPPKESGLKIGDKLYRHAQPAPVVPDEVTYVQAEKLSGWQSCSDAWADGWNACRAAMLNGGKS